MEPARSGRTGQGAGTPPAVKSPHAPSALSLQHRDRARDQAQRCAPYLDSLPAGSRLVFVQPERNRRIAIVKLNVDMGDPRRGCPQLPQATLVGLAGNDLGLGNELTGDTHGASLKQLTRLVDRCNGNGGQGFALWNLSAEHPRLVATDGCDRTPLLGRGTLVAGLLIPARLAATLDFTASNRLPEMHNLLMREVHALEACVNRLPYAAVLEEGVQEPPAVPDGYGEMGRELAAGWDEVVSHVRTLADLRRPSAGMAAAGWIECIPPQAPDGSAQVQAS